MTTADAVLCLLGLIVLGAGLLVVTARSVVRAALWLVVSLGALAGCYVVLTAEFVAVVQILIYVGAVIVLLLFALMFTRARPGLFDDVDSGNRPAALLVAVAAAALLIWLLVDAFRWSLVDLHAGDGSAEALGAVIFRWYVLPFEVVSALLLAALIGAIVMSRPTVGAGGER